MDSSVRDIPLSDVRSDSDSLDSDNPEPSSRITGGVFMNQDIGPTDQGE
jgi:hypothetical protein